MRHDFRCIQRWTIFASDWSVVPLSCFVIWLCRQIRTLYNTGGLWVRLQNLQWLIPILFHVTLSFKICESRLQPSPRGHSCCPWGSPRRWLHLTYVWNRWRQFEAITSRRRMARACRARRWRCWASRLQGPKPTFTAQLKESPARHWWAWAALLHRHHWHFHSLQF